MSEILKIGEIEVEENTKRSGTLKVAGRNLSPIEPVRRYVYLLVSTDASMPELKYV
jgi:hypothetical protein